MKDESMRGRVCLVTGATSGIGEAAARELARRGATVVIVGRSREKCEATASLIRAETAGAEASSIVADLSSMAEVRRAAAEFLSRHDRLHVLVNNAGALFALRRESVDGIEMTLALNHLAPFLLTNLLLETLKRSAPARVVTVSSGAHTDVRAFDFEDPQARGAKRGYGVSERASFVKCLTTPWAHPGFAQYAQTKLANLLFAFELARRLEGTGVTSNALHPGFVATGFTSGNGALGWFLRRWAALFGLSAEEGARTVVRLACAPELEKVCGKYFVREREAESSRASRDVEAGRRLWEMSEGWVGGGLTIALGGVRVDMPEHGGWAC